MSFFHIVRFEIGLSYAIATNTVTTLVLFTVIGHREGAEITTNCGKPFLVYVFSRINRNCSCPFIFIVKMLVKHVAMLLLVGVEESVC